MAGKRGGSGSFPSEKKSLYEKIREAVVQTLKISRQCDITFMYMTERTYGDMIVAVSYKQLFHLLIERDMIITQIQHKAGFFLSIVLRTKRIYLSGYN